jgi:hypothetical protein
MGTSGMGRAAPFSVTRIASVGNEGHHRQHRLVSLFSHAISLMAGECRVGTEVDVANQPKVCCTAAEGVLSLAAELAHSNLAPGRRFELRTLRLTDRCGPFRNHGSSC